MKNFISLRKTCEAYKKTSLARYGHNNERKTERYNLFVIIQLQHTKSQILTTYPRAQISQH